MAMKMGDLVVCGLAGVLAAGCGQQVARTPKSTAPDSALSASTEVPVPLPAKTPFDANAGIRAVYLEYYALGFRMASMDYASLGCMCIFEGDTERHEAASAGFYAGKGAGSAELAKTRPQTAPPEADKPEPSMAPLSSPKR